MAKRKDNRRIRTSGKPAEEKPVAPKDPPKKNEPEGKESKKKRKGGVRETVEAVVFAFILAFMFRTFEAEAFVIPTGSMAPTLYGRHKQITCEQCKTSWAVGASDELQRETDLYISHMRLLRARCPNCRWEQDIKDEPVFKGDRLLVNKFSYEFGGNPSRWDVIVFRYPERSQMNYIKRLIGLPGEAIRIFQGNIYARRKDTEPWVILRKDDPTKQTVVQQLVYDNDHQAVSLHEKGWPRRWDNAERTDEGDWKSGSPGAWQAGDENDFSIKSTSSLNWLRYRHFVPTKAIWKAAKSGKIPKDLIKPRLIIDYNGYNAYSVRESDDSPSPPVAWVNELTLNCEVEINDVEKGGETVLELVRGKRRFRVRIDLESGEAKASVIDRRLLDPTVKADETTFAKAKTRMNGNGTYRIVFSDVDDRILLWINGRLTEWEHVGTPQAGLKPGEYPSSSGDFIQATRDDLAPAGVAVRNAAATVSHLLLQRDIYYRAEKIDDEDARFPRLSPKHAFQQRSEFGTGGDFLGYRRRLDDPEAWFAFYAQKTMPYGVEFAPMKDDEYFMMGDNSARSQDSRLWPNLGIYGVKDSRERRHAVPRRALVGKAFFIYWPHGVPFLNGGKGWGIRNHQPIHPVHPDEKGPYPSFRVPFYPNVGRMYRVR